MKKQKISIDDKVYYLLGRNKNGEKVFFKDFYFRESQWFGGDIVIIDNFGEVREIKDEEILLDNAIKWKEYFEECVLNDDEIWDLIVLVNFYRILYKVSYKFRYPPVGLSKKIKKGIFLFEQDEKFSDLVNEKIEKEIVAGIRKLLWR